MEFDYTVKTNKTFDETVIAIKEETLKAGFSVLHIHDIKEKLSTMGFEIEPLKIIEVCNAKSAYKVLQEDIKISLCLPCKINVYIKNGQTFISGMRPIILPQFFPKANLGKLPQEIDQIIQDIINNAK
ncbi:DUF302 domain-containing protein [Patescibacteria group bacterium]|nr:DUF302 domain-containing protein [Patescibacteria group bacterium]